jgi:hypothetical protein
MVGGTYVAPDGPNDDNDDIEHNSQWMIVGHEATSGWKDGDRCGLAEREQTHGKKESPLAGG